MSTQILYTGDKLHAFLKPSFLPVWDYNMKSMLAKEFGICELKSKDIGGFRFEHTDIIFIIFPYKRFEKEKSLKRERHRLNFTSTFQ